MNCDSTTVCIILCLPLIYGIIMCLPLIYYYSGIGTNSSFGAWQYDKLLVWCAEDIQISGAAGSMLLIWEVPSYYLDHTKDRWASCIAQDPLIQQRQHVKLLVWCRAI